MHRNNLVKELKRTWTKDSFELLTSFHNVSQSSIAHIYIDVDESRHIYTHIHTLCFG